MFTNLQFPFEKRNQKLKFHRKTKKSSLNSFFNKINFIGKKNYHKSRTRNKSVVTFTVILNSKDYINKSESKNEDQEKFKTTYGQCLSIRF